MLTQVAGIVAAPSTWRFVFLISFILSVLQTFFSPIIVESPTWLLNEYEEISELSPQKSLTITQVLATESLRNPLIIVTLAMLSQQLSGKCHLVSRLG